MIPPKLSIITVCYNESNIEATCLSIANQTWKGFEWIVVDGGSTDGTVDTLKKYEDHIRVLVSEKDKGIYNAMNKGIFLAQGEYVIFMNGGDYFLNIYSLAGIFQHHELIEDIVCCDAIFVLDGGKILLREFKPLLPITADFFRERCIAHQATFIKRRLFDLYGGYNEDRRVVADWEKWIEFTKIHQIKIDHIESTLAIHHYTGISARQDENHLRERREVMGKYFPEQELLAAGESAAPNPTSETAGKKVRLSRTNDFINYYKVILCDIIPFLQITRSQSPGNYKFYLFNFILIFKSVSK